MSNPPASVLAELGRRRAALAGRRELEHGLDPWLANVRRELPALADAVEAEAAGWDRPPAELLALDGGFFDALVGGEHERGIGLYVNGPAGPVLGGSWTLPRAMAEGLSLARTTGGWVLAAPGACALATVSDSGVVALGLALRPAVVRIDGLPGATVLRALADVPDLDGARALVETVTLADGRAWMLADRQRFLGFEHLGGERILTRVGPKTGHVHVNHCFDPSLRQREHDPRSPASYRRLELASTLYVQRRPTTLEGVCTFFDAVEVAAFAEPERAQTQFVVEIETRRACLRRHLDAHPQTRRLS